MSRDLKLVPVGLSRPEAAAYVGMGITLFDKLVEDGRMPRPRRAEGRLIWSRKELEDAFDNLPYHGTPVVGGLDAGNSWATGLARGRRENTA